MKKGGAMAFPALVLLAGCLCALYLYRLPAGWSNDIVAFNRIERDTARHWDELDTIEYQDSDYRFSVLELDGTVRYRSDEHAVTSVSQAISEGDPILDVKKEGEIVGKVIITQNPGGVLLRYKNAASLLVLVVSAAAALVSGMYFTYLRHTILKPFQELEYFAAEVSRGNLDFPLGKRKNNIFGAFTQSFDLMREQLKEAREKEVRASMSQKELVASLSHDIKTPVTSIKITSELLIELEQEERLKEKIRMIYQKTEQIEELVSNLFSTTLQDMEHLTVNPACVYSSKLEEMIRNADPKEAVRFTPVPDCMLYLDELRFTQVLSNIISNSYKYADTAIDVSASLIDTHLKLYIRDYGKSLEQEELPLVMNKFYRGKNAGREYGSGLGLYICKKLMEQMQGEIYCACSTEGFTAVLMIKLF